jgi:hypothetical protein
MNQVHKENLTHVENANPGRQGLELEIFGMEGVPAEIIDQHNTQVTQAHFAEAHARALETGNPISGTLANGQAAPPNKRPRVNESLEEIEERADKFRTDRKNGVVMPPVEPVQNPVCTDVFFDLKTECNANHYLQTPPVAQSPYGAPPAGAPSAFPPNYPSQPFSPSNDAMPPRPGSIPGQPGALPPRPGFGAPPPGAFPPGQNGEISNSIDDLIGEVTKEAAPEKKSKKDKNQRLIFFAETTSPEEKMALLPRFAEFMRT